MKSDICNISIIIVNYNTRDLLISCIESIYNYTKKSNIEIIVIDNDSKDGSAEAVKKTFKDVILIESHENLGFGKANNVGIRQAKGEYVCLVNSDIELIENTFDIIYDYMEKNKSIGVVGPKTVNADRSVNPNVRKFPTLWNCFCDCFYVSKVLSRFKHFQGRTLKNFDYDTESIVEVLSGCFMFIRRAALEQVGELDERFFIYGEDTDWGMRFKKAGWPCLYWPGTTVIHLEGASSKKENIRFLKELEKADYQYWVKYNNLFIMMIYTYLKLHYHVSSAIVWFLLIFIMPHKAKSCFNRVRGRLARIGFLLFERFKYKRKVYER